MSATLQEADKTYGALLTVEEAAGWLSVSPHTMRAWIQRGLIESHKLFGLRRVSEDELVRIIEESKSPAISETRPRVKSLATTTPDRA